MDKPLYQTIQSIFSDYYRCLEHGIQQVQSCSKDNKFINDIKAQIDEELNMFRRIAEFAGITDKDAYFKSVQERLQQEGYYLDITPQYGIDIGSLDLKTVDNISLRPVLARGKRKARLGNQEIEYIEFILGKSLIEIPDFLEVIVESASAQEVSIFPEELQDCFDRDHQAYQRDWEESLKRYEPGVVSSDNLYCVQLRLHKRQWVDPADLDVKDLLIQHSRVHGQQHVLDFRLIEGGKLTFALIDPTIDVSLNKDAVMEARVLLRLLIDKIAPFYTCVQIIQYAREWIEGSRSEYAWAGHILFFSLSRSRGEEFEDGKWWVSGVEASSESDIYQLAIRAAYKDKNFVDMLTDAQKKEAAQILT